MLNKDENIVCNSIEVKKCFQEIMANQQVKYGLKFLEEDHENTIKELKQISSIPAPPFHEDARAKEYMRRLKALGLQDVQIDEEGNAFGKRPGLGNGPKLLISAHLDTVFPLGTDTSVKEKDGLLYGPGIADDSRGLAEILSIIRAFNESGIETIGDIIFCGNVGEEGIGDLRGIKHFFREHKDIDGFITIDGTGVTAITYLAVGSRRYKVTYKGLGGHSFGSYGLPSATHALGRAISKIADLRPPTNPKTTFTIGKVEGGISVNAIAKEASMYVDIRSSSKVEIEKLESAILDCVRISAKEENKRWNHEKKIVVQTELIGDRPTGEQSVQESIVQAAIAAIESLKLVPKLNGPISTDANIPISLGIPAISVGRGGISGNTHTLDEWFDPKNAYIGPQKTFLTLLGLVGIKDVCRPILAKQ